MLNDLILTYHKQYVNVGEFLDLNVLIEHAFLKLLSSELQQDDPEFEKLIV